MKKNIVKEKLAAGKPTVGTWLAMGSWLAAEYMAHIGFDWLVVDTEHTPIGFENTVHCFQSICSTDTVPLSRVAWNDRTLIGRLLDGGAMGLVVPMVNSPEEAERAVASMKYPPEGSRSISGGRAKLYGADYLDRANDEIAVIVQIEHIDAVNKVEGILSVPGIDSCFVGPSDLAGSMGLKPDIECRHPDHAAAIMQVLETAKRLGVPAGIHCGNSKAANMRIEQGFQFVAVASDARILKGAATEILSDLSPGAVG